MPLLRPTLRGILGQVPPPTALRGSTARTAAAPAGASNRGYLPAPLNEAPPPTLKDAAPASWVRRIVTTVNNTLAGKMNAVLPITLDVDSPTTTVIDSRISAFSALVFAPITANAAAEIGNGTLYASSQQSGQATLTHANNGQADRSFRLLIIG